MIRSAWPDPIAPGQREVVDGLCALIQQLDTSPTEWRATLGAPIPDETARRRSAYFEGMGLAEATARDGVQRAIDYQPDSLDDLLELRVELRDAITSTPEGSELRHVRPWTWTEASGGTALTAAGLERGAELRLSRYRNPR